ncbi:MAG: large conductance mechanosensitive channel protein MscL [Candidatus Bipolaricaulota bacterium]|nr:large conductance mechanosensitive channel protein MscL [Candidatus Bipolaricaulota bacterium]
MGKEFKAFIVKGNLVQIAVAFIMGVAFGAVVSSFVNDLIMPIIGKLVGNVDFANLYVNLSGQTYESAAAARAAGAAAIYYGAFINAVVNFLIIAAVVFLIVKAYGRLEKPKVAPAPTTKECPFCKTQIPLEATRCPNCTSELGGRG